MSNNPSDIRSAAEKQLDAFNAPESVPQYTANNERVKSLTKSINSLISEISEFDLDDKVSIINDVRECLHGLSPFSKEPVDFVRWVKNDTVNSNDYNPNSVAPPEMELLRLSIESDGYTQPIVSWEDEGCTEVIDGFHRHRVGKECEDIQARIHGYLPIVSVNNDSTGRNDRIASTIRHNRARGKHKIDAMSDIVIELKRRNWSPKKIGIQLGMDQDEVLRLCQITGLGEMFKDKEFSEAWEVGDFDENDFDGDRDAIN